MKLFFQAGLLMTMVLGICIGCKKNSASGGSKTGPGVVLTAADSVYSPTDPGASAGIGFFGNDWKARAFAVSATTAGVAATGVMTDTLTIDANKVLVKVPTYVFGNNSNLWMSQIVDQASLMGYIKDLAPGIIRAPAGSASDIYFWNDTTAAPADAPANLLDATGASSAAGYWFGGNTASWTLSLGNYYNMLSQTGSTGIITVNYGYARYGTSANPVATAAHLAADWVRHDNGRTKFWEIGNETYGNWEAGYRIDVSQNKDGQPAVITGALYGQHVKVFVDSMRAAAQQLGVTIYIGATLYQQAPASGDDVVVQTWNQGVLAQAGNAPDFYIVHDYFTPYGANSTADDILSNAATEPTAVMNFIRQQISAAGVSMKPVALTEWNIRAEGSKQEVSYIAGIHAAKALGAIIKNQFGEASRWDLANGWNKGNDQGMFSSGGEPGAALWNPRPAFFYLYYFQHFMGDRMVYDTLNAINGDLTSYSSTFSSGQLGTIIVNSGMYNHSVEVDLRHWPVGANYYWYVLTGGTDNGSFSGQVYVNGAGPSSGVGGPLNYSTLPAYKAPVSGTIKLSVPAHSVVYLAVDKKQ